MDYFKEYRKSFIEIGRIYFWTATINSWYKLMSDDEVKKIIVDSLKYLHEKGKIEIYAFVVMPNHVHLVWKIKELNGKETSHGSFLKYTAHEFKKHLREANPDFLKLFAVKAENKEYEFWQRDSLAFELTQRDTAFQKINYIHNNPLSERWQLCDDPVKYYYSSAKFYESGIDDFGFLTHIMEVF